MLCTKIPNERISSDGQLDRRRIQRWRFIALENLVLRPAIIEGAASIA